MAKQQQSRQERERARARERDRMSASEQNRDAPNPPRTTTGNITSPKFGSAGSGGAELEPGPERD